MLALDTFEYLLNIFVFTKLGKSHLLVILLLSTMFLQEYWTHNWLQNIIMLSINCQQFIGIILSFAVVTTIIYLFQIK